MLCDQPWHRGEEHMMHECLNSHNSYHMFQWVSHRHLHTINSSAQEIFRVSNQLDLHVFKESPLMKGRSYKLLTEFINQTNIINVTSQCHIQQRKQIN